MAATVWQGRIAFGMVAIPVRLYKAARRERTRFHHVYRPAEHAPEPPPEQPSEPADKRSPHVVPDDVVEPSSPGVEPNSGEREDVTPIARVHTRPVGAEQDETVLEPSRFLKGYELEKDRYAVFEPAELAALRPRTSTELNILEFVRMEEIAPIFLDTSYYVAPNRGGEKPYALLFRALKESGRVALGTLAMHGREHATVIRPGRSGLILHTMFYANEVRSAEEYGTGAELASPKELELAMLLIDATTATFDPAKLKDTFEERVRALIASRAGSAVSLQSGAEPSRTAPVPDILEALRRSLEAIRKPAKRESGGHRVTSKQRVRRRNTSS